MLDVDGQVISAGALIQRVEQLVGTIDTSQVSAGGSHQAEPPQLDAPIHEMRVIHGQMHPPDLRGTGGVRGRISSALKRLVRRLTSWYVEPRWILQQGLDSQSIEFAAQAYNNIWRIDVELAELRRQNARLKLQLVASSERMSRHLLGYEELREDVAAQRGILARTAMEEDIQPLHTEIKTVLDRLGAVGTSGANIDYVEFENRFRGDHNELAASQERYVSLFPPASETGLIIDIGCGRGEMLSLLERAGQEAVGVDTDPGMVEFCTSTGLTAVLDDGIHYLSQVPADSLKGIFCAQVVEHLITPELEQLVLLAYRSLRLGGVLVIETINPRSSYALGNHFYADTSHVRPVHPETLRFICEQIGFQRVELEERSPHPSLALGAELPQGPTARAVETLLANVFGYQDYVIVATK